MVNDHIQQMSKNNVTTGPCQITRN